jgi:hypothetical protein
MNNQGWVKIHRQLLDNPIISKPDYLSIWVVLLLLANHQEHSFIWNNKKQICKRGQVLTGRKELARKTGVNESKIERILKYLKNEQQIEQQTTTKFRLITIKNYNQYQDFEQQNEQQVNNKRTTSEQQMNTNKNDNNIKNDNNEKNKDIQTIIDCYQNSFNKRFKVLNDKRKKYFRGRLKNFTVEEITRSIENYSRTKFYTGENDRGWSADLDFIMRSDENIEKGLNLELDSNAKKFNQNDIPEAERIYFGEVFFNSSQFRQLKNKGLILGDAYKGWELDPLWQDKSPFEYNIY